MPGSCLATHTSLLVHLSIISAKGMWCLPTSHFVNPVSGFLVLRLLQLFPRIPAPILATRSTTLFVLKAAPLHRVPLFLSPLFGRRNFYLLEPGGSVNPASARFDGSYENEMCSLEVPIVILVNCNKEQITLVISICFCTCFLVHILACHLTHPRQDNYVLSIVK